MLQRIPWTGSIFPLSFTVGFANLDGNDQSTVLQNLWVYGADGNYIFYQQAFDSEDIITPCPKILYTKIQSNIELLFICLNYTIKHLFDISLLL